MAPVVNGVAHGSLQRGCPSPELLLIRCIAGDEALRHTTGPHQAPFVVVALQPQLGEVGKGAVFCDFLGADVAMIIHDGLLLRHTVVQLTGRLGIQQKLLVHKMLHFQ